jgi:hypothetical protein
LAKGGVASRLTHSVSLFTRAATVFHRQAAPACPRMPGAGASLPHRRAARGVRNYLDAWTEGGVRRKLWLDSAHASEKGFLIPGTPPRYAADLRLSVDGVHVEKAGIDITLPWTETGRSWHLGSYVRRRKTIDRVGAPSTPSGGIINAGLYARGEYANRMVPIFLALKAGRRRLPFTDPFKRGIGASYVVPLYARRNDTVFSKDAWSIWNLCLVLAQRPELQPRLGEPIRMENLVRDLKQTHLAVVRAHLGVRTESVEIRTAMRGANIVHPLGGRPVPGDVLVDRDEAVSRIVARMATVPYSKGAKVISKHVEEILDAEYFNVEHWPFAALVRDSGGPSPGPE